ncbi:hypothetical protein [Methylobacterium trifolii]|uniref:Peptidase S8/S53 domain-containing protein n=1 Tax=Methylobacterium trifolii TaxID=1003092 RepID=A0ABQ4U6W4_9HYPH|nr:hypothetical protein [Methylobacterium trifolii]GJE62704.1 hypothetical protein MPOCJGCO_4839 [Methylobacterium trifolii]
MVGASDAPVNAGENVVVAVLDSSIVDHRSFNNAPAFEKTPTFNSLEIDLKNFISEIGDVIGHSTHTAATIFGRDINGTRIGVVRGVRKALISKILSKTDTCTTQIILDGMM